jgi:hypothetical protein
LNEFLLRNLLKDFYDQFPVADVLGKFKADFLSICEGEVTIFQRPGIYIAIFENGFLDGQPFPRTLETDFTSLIGKIKRTDQMLRDIAKKALLCN